MPRVKEKGEEEREEERAKGKRSIGMKHTHSLVHIPAYLNNCFLTFQRCPGDPGNLHLAEKHSLSQGADCHTVPQQKTGNLLEISN